MTFFFFVFLFFFFHVSVRRDSVSLLRFPLLSHVQVFSSEILSVCRLKYPYSCFSSHFYFQVIVVLFTFILSALFLVAVNHHHYHVVRPTRISLTLSLHVSLSFIASGRSSGLHPVSSHSCCMYVRAGRPAFDWPYAGVHMSTSLTSSSLLLQQCPACLVCLAWIVFVIGGRWPYSWCLVGCCC